MKVIAPSRRYLPALSRFVDEGEELDLPDTVGESLIAQGWKQPKTKTTKEKP